MKIALITIHNVGNYGAVLQAFATKQILSRYGEVETINYFNPCLPGQLDLIRFEPSIHGIKIMIHDILRLKDRKKVVRKFKKFIESNMTLSKLVTRHEIENGAINDYFDAYVCGSDQIWNPQLVSKDKELEPVYFLNFASKKAKKISYASSMGGHYRLKNSEKEKIRNLLTDFTAISVRESETQEMLSQLLEREVFHVLDPTLLLSKEEWFEALKIDKNYRSQKEDFILVYRVAKDPLLRKVVESFVKKLGNKKVVVLDQAFRPFINGDIHIRDAGPIEFIELFSNASFVITNSFHGVCFSINFKKPFAPVWGGKGGNRIGSFLKLFDLKDRLINDEQNIKLNANFDYEFLENKLKNERAKSIRVLSSSIAS